jgi:hypothetical protein
MKNTITLCLLVCGLNCLATNTFAAIDPSSLVKVTDKMSQQCVEYYSYQNEMYCSTTRLQPTTVDPIIKTYETQKIVFDSRPWQAAWGKKTDTSATVEYVPMGDHIDSWHELITSQFFAGIQDKTTLKAFAMLVIKGIEDAGFKPVVRFIKETPEQVMFEFKIDSPASQIQDELQVVTKGKDGIYALHYAIKEKNMSDEHRKTWIANLSASTLKN